MMRSIERSSLGGKGAMALPSLEIFPITLLMALFGSTPRVVFSSAVICWVVDVGSWEWVCVLSFVLSFCVGAGMSWVLCGWSCEGLTTRATHDSPRHLLCLDHVAVIRPCSPNDHDISHVPDMSATFPTKLTSSWLWRECDLISFLINEWLPIPPRARAVVLLNARNVQPCVSISVHSPTPRRKTPQHHISFQMSMSIIVATQKAEWEMRTLTWHMAMNHWSAQKCVVTVWHQLRRPGIEPRANAWKAFMLPLHHRR